MEKLRPQVHWSRKTDEIQDHYKGSSYQTADGPFLQDNGVCMCAWLHGDCQCVRVWKRACMRAYVSAFMCKLVSVRVVCVCVCKWGFLRGCLEPRASLVWFSLRFFRVARATFGFAERTDWCIPMDLLVAGQTSLETDNKLNQYHLFDSMTPIHVSSHLHVPIEFHSISYTFLTSFKVLLNFCSCNPPFCWGQGNPDYLD